MIWEPDWASFESNDPDEEEHPGTFTCYDCGHKEEA
jgi:hypothetical protein